MYGPPTNCNTHSPRTLCGRETGTANFSLPTLTWFEQAARIVRQRLDRGRDSIAASREQSGSTAVEHNSESPAAHATDPARSLVLQGWSLHGLWMRFVFCRRGREWVDPMKQLPESGRWSQQCSSAGVRIQGELRRPNRLTRRSACALWPQTPSSSHRREQAAPILVATEREIVW